MSSTILALALLMVARNVGANPATLPWTDCFDSSANVSQKMTVSSVFAQVLHGVDDVYLNLTVVGESPQQILAYSNSNLATLFTSTSVLTLSAWTNSSYLCEPLRSPSPQPPTDNTTAYCPIPSGPFAFSTSIPWGSRRELTTLVTRLRAVDPFSSELLCLEVQTTPLRPSSDSPYGIAKTVFWASVALAISYWFVIGVARLVSAWNRGNTRPGGGLWSNAQRAGFIFASAISGERLTTSPALMRYSTPSMRDVIFHTQWCSALAMVAVQWPRFAYPLLIQTAWAMLTYNVTLADSLNHHWDPLSTGSYNPPPNFADQISNPASSLYIDPNTPNILYTLPENATSGISSFAYTVGVRPEDLFGISLIIFLGIVAGTIALSSFVWFVDHLATLILGVFVSPPNGRTAGTRSPVFSSSIKDPLDTPAIVAIEESKSLNGRETPGLTRPSSRFGISGGNAGHRPWWKWRNSIGSFHGSVLHGNLVRILVLFHLPITIFSVYEMTLPRSRVDVSSIALSGLAFSIISVLIPVFLVVRVRVTSTNKLYDETRTLLSLGPLYNHYRHGSQMFAGLFFATNLVVGVTIGAGQKSGTAQAIIILVVEVVSALVTSLWLPWGTGASMGLISFLFCVARIVVAVLLVILTPTISIGDGPSGWVAYGILVILALIYLAFILLLAVKLIEAIVRIVGGVGFERSKHVVDSGLLGACGLAGCCGRRSRRRHRHNKSSSKNRYNKTSRSQRDSDISSYMPPIMPGSTGPGSRKGSMHSGPPPSVLRPEHAQRPYREENDDEHGYIMGAWQPYPTKPAGYVPVLDPGTTSPPARQPQETPPPQSSGFSRVGGGRAHIDAPYAISPAAAAFPSYGHEPQASTSTNNTKATKSSATVVSSPLRDYNDDAPSVSSTPVRQRHHSRSGSGSGSGTGILPPGAMAPFHVRTKSQSAIIENAGGVSRPASRTMMMLDPSSLNNNSNNSSAPPSSYHHPAENNDDDDDDDDDSDLGQRKKKWYHIRRQRPHSSEGNAGSGIAGNGSLSSQNVVDEEAALEVPSILSTPSRSFVVIRKQKPSPARSQHPSSHGSASTSPKNTPTPTTTSFTAT